MKIAISIPDELFQEAEKVAAELKLSRSALYAKALREHVERLKDEAITAQINACLAEDGPQEPDLFMQRAAYLMAKRAGGDW
jgi:predicted transcriptional regulator